MMSQQDLPTLFYSGKSNSAVPIISESELQTITAEPWLEISKKGLQLEGLNFAGTTLFIGCIRRQYFQNQS